jgi:hypothetical protein
MIYCGLQLLLIVTNYIDWLCRPYLFIESLLETSICIYTWLADSWLFILLANVELLGGSRQQEMHGV